MDGLRAIACIGIIMMHMASNNKYEIGGYIYNTIIPSFTNLVFLFMVISTFGICDRYYEKMLNNQINLSSYFGKRYKMILPFYAILVVIDLCVSPSLSALYEGFADITLLFGF